jgi:hypothetical protein
MGELALALLPFASRSARIHVERAGRVLNTTENNAMMAPMTLPSRDPGRATPTRQSADFDSGGQPMRMRTPPANSQQPNLHQSDPQRSIGQRLPITDTESRASWENPRGRQQTISAHPQGSGRRSAIFLVAGSAVALAVAGAYFWSTQRNESARSVTPVLSAVTDTAPAPSRGPAEAMPTAAAGSPEPPSEAIHKVDAAGVSPDEAAKAPVEPAHAARPGTAPTAAREPAPELRTRRTTPTQAPQAPTATGKGLTDFGGRR